MPNTFTKIASVTVGSGGAASMSFTSIPSTYTDLCVKLSTRSTKVAIVDNVVVKFNTSSTTFTTIRLIGNGTAVNNYSASTGYVSETAATTTTANTFSNQEIYIPNYAGSTNKSYSVDGAEENNGAQAYLTFTAGLWSTTSAINQITLYLELADNFVQYSTATLYGIKNS